MQHYFASYVRISLNASRQNRANPRLASRRAEMTLVERDQAVRPTIDRGLQYHLVGGVQAGSLHTLALLINCSACFSASGVSFCPESIRPTSRVRAAASSSSITATVRPLDSCFSTR